MHWILMVGIHMNLSVKMGSFESEKACEKASMRFMEVFAKKAEMTVASCFESTSPLLKMYDR